MKFNKYIFFLLGLSTLLTSCRDEALNPVPQWDTAVHGYAKIADPYGFGGPTLSVAKASQATQAANDWRWVSIDGQNTVTKAEFSVFFNEAYVDKDQNDRIARHGGVIFNDKGKLWKTLDGSTLPGNRAYTNLKIAPTDVYALYKDATFDYKDGKGVVKVFEQRGRSAAAPLLTSDAIAVSWALYTADGRKFDIWDNGNVCNGTVGVNCQINLVVK